jgi:signal peptidase I
MKKKIIFSCLGIIVIFVITIIIIIKLVPGKTILKLTGGDNKVSDILCIYPTKISGSSMLPTFKEGETVNFNKCIEDKENIEVDTIVLFKEGEILRVGRIRNKESGESGIYFKVSPDARIPEVTDVFPDAIQGVFEE